VEDVHPRLRCITLAGGDLTVFAPLGPDTFVYVLLPPPGRTQLTIDATFGWEAYGQLPPQEQPVGAYYTARAWRPETAELDLLFVLHEPAGPASAWAAAAQPGDPVAIWGPREAFTPSAATGRVLLVADETGLPAVAAILEWLPVHWPAVVAAEVDGPELRQPLSQRAGDRVVWVDRNGRPPGTATELLVDAVRSLGPLADDTYVWGGGESRAMTAMRKYVRGEVGLRREQVALVAYWRHADDQTVASDDD
jgi:NADPH-dependent ferric siderophore reductase